MQNSRFCTISSLHRELSPTCTFMCEHVQVMGNIMGAYQTQYVLCLLPRYGIVHHLLLTKLKSHLLFVLFHWLKTVNDEGEKKTGVPKKTLATSSRYSLWLERNHFYANFVVTETMNQWRLPSPMDVNPPAVDGTCCCSSCRVLLMISVKLALTLADPLNVTIPTLSPSLAPETT